MMIWHRFRVFLLSSNKLHSITRHRHCSQIGFINQQHSASPVYWNMIRYCNYVSINTATSPIESLRLQAAALLNSKITIPDTESKKDYHVHTLYQLPTNIQSRPNTIQLQQILSLIRSINQSDLLVFDRQHLLEYVLSSLVTNNISLSAVVQEAYHLPSPSSVTSIAKANQAIEFIKQKGLLPDAAVYTYLFICLCDHSVETKSDIIMFIETISSSWMSWTYVSILSQLLKWKDFDYFDALVKEYQMEYQQMGATAWNLDQDQVDIFSLELNVLQIEAATVQQKFNECGVLIEHLTRHIRLLSPKGLNVLAKLCALTGDIPALWRIFNYSESSVNAQVYIEIIQGINKNRLFYFVQKAFSRLDIVWHESLGSKSLMYNIVLKACLKLERFKHAIKYFDCMQKDGVIPDTATLNIIIPIINKSSEKTRHYLVDKIEERLHAANDDQTAEFLATKVLYASTQGNLMSARREFKRIALPSIETFEVMAVACLKFEATLQEAENAINGLYMQMQTAGVVPTDAFFSTAIDTFCTPVNESCVEKWIERAKQVNIPVGLMSLKLIKYYGQTKSDYRRMRDVYYELCWLRSCGPTIEHDAEMIHGLTQMMADIQYKARFATTESKDQQPRDEWTLDEIYDFVLKIWNSYSISERLDSTSLCRAFFVWCCSCKDYTLLFSEWRLLRSYEPKSSTDSNTYKSTVTANHSPVPGQLYVQLFDELLKNDRIQDAVQVIVEDMVLDRGTLTVRQAKQILRLLSIGNQGQAMEKVWKMMVREYPQVAAQVYVEIPRSLKQIEGIY
ncbi:hypothetical protein QVD99_002782 [Batrachochytrium dendrobatidis]|nr:hypothetical protein O5D80_007009 [Batrachochytrium dendrobatidis]KAK5671017.1 hypothetical protein QVD99_002782 [Batrachochytrium dendrobatidis]